MTDNKWNNGYDYEAMDAESRETEVDNCEHYGEAEVIVTHYAIDLAQNKGII